MLTCQHSKNTFHVTSQANYKQKKNQNLISMRQNCHVLGDHLKVLFLRNQKKKKQGLWLRLRHLGRPPFAVNSSTTSKFIRYR